MEESITALKEEIIDSTAKRVSGDVLKELEEKLSTKFPTMDEIKKMFAEHKPETRTLSADEKAEEEVKFWQDLAHGKATGDITDTGTAATLIPSTVAKKILDQIQAAGYVRKITTIFPDDKGTLFVKSQGATAYRTAEGVAPTGSTLKYNKKDYLTTEVGADTIVSNKLLREANPQLLQFVYKQLGQAFANLEVVEFITGTGTGEFEGLNAATIPTVTATTTHTTIDKLTYDDFRSVLLGTPKQYRGISSWIISSTVEQQVAQIQKSDVKYTDLFDMAAGTILGRPYVVNDNLSTTGTTNPVLYFGFWKDYYVFDKGGIAIVTTNQGKELVSKRQTYMLAIANTDGKTIDTTGMRGLKLASS